MRTGGRPCAALRAVPDPSAPATEPQENVTPDANFAFDLLSPDSPRSLARISPFWNQVWERGEPDWVLQAGQYEYAPDHRPYLGPSVVPGLVLNCGYSGHGIMASAGGDRLTIDALLGKVTPAENPFRPTARSWSARSTSCSRRAERRPAPQLDQEGWGAELPYRCCRAGKVASPS